MNSERKDAVVRSLIAAGAEFSFGGGIVLGILAEIASGGIAIPAFLVLSGLASAVWFGAGSNIRRATNLIDPNKNTPLFRTPVHEFGYKLFHPSRRSI